MDGDNAINEMDEFSTEAGNDPHSLPQHRQQFF